MKYYSFSISPEPEVIGVDNGIHQADMRFDLFDKDEFHKMETFFDRLKLWRKEDEIPNFECHFHAELYRKAKMTDFIKFCPSIYCVPFFISNRAINLISKFFVKDFYTFPSTLYNKLGEVVSNNYRLFYMPFLSYDIIDFNSSTFINRRSKVELVYLNQEEYMANRSYDISPQFTTILVPSDKPLHMFNFRFGGLYVSEELKIAMEEAGITGPEYRIPTEPAIEVIYV